MHLVKNNKNFKDKNNFVNRKSGILLHPSSLPGEYGIGELGSEAFRFVDFLYNSKQKLWQILPLGPTGYGNSPYSCFSAFAGNPFLISIEQLNLTGYLQQDLLEELMSLPKDKVDFSSLIPLKWKILQEYYNNYDFKKEKKEKNRFRSFCRINYYWLEHFAIFMSLKEFFNGKSWIDWPDDYRSAKKNILNQWKSQHYEKIRFHKFIQYLFFKQWTEIYNYAHSKNILIIGDLPIFVAFDSVDVWINQKMFYLDDSGNPLYVAGVPPDLFSDSGQRWGNPLYRWDFLRKKRFRWWINRIKFALKSVDLVRIDHFRGFEAFWQIPAGEETAINGKWVKGPGKEFFTAIKTQLGNVPIIAEDLGVITPEVDQLRELFAIPGMKVLQFAFDGEVTNKYLPENYESNQFIVYTGTHDNETTKDWFKNLSRKSRQFVLDYLKSTGFDIVGDLAEIAWKSKANFAIIPMQDLLRLGNEARMNLPGSNRENWIWRFEWDQIDDKNLKELKSLTVKNNR